LNLIDLIEQLSVMYNTYIDASYKGTMKETKSLSYDTDFLQYRNLLTEKSRK